MKGTPLSEGLARLRSPWISVPAVVCLLAALTLSFDAPLVFAGAVACVALLFLLLHPVVATLLTLFAVYANLPVLAARLYGVPTLLAGSAVLLLALPLAHHLVLRRERIRADRTFALMLLLLTVMTTSATLATEPGLAMARLQVFLLEGIVLYWLVLNVVRDLRTFRRVVWTLLAAGALLGGVAGWQAVSDSHGREFGGLAHRETEVLITEQPDPEAPTEVRVSNRASGPVDEPNRFGQILIVLLPLAVFCYRTAASRVLRVGAVATGGLALGGVVLTHSRGAFLVLVALAGLAVWVRWLRPAHVFAGVLALALALPFVAPTYTDRIASIGGARDLLEDQPNVRADGAIRGRTTEMLAALHVFLDHPVIGVGPGQYAPVYSVEYQTQPGVAFRDLRRPRRAHSLYLELAAEAGAIGLAVFLAMVALLFKDLARARRRSVSREMSELATALAFGLAAYLGTATFLHLSFERYFWLLLAVVSAGLHLIRQAEGASAQAPAPAAAPGGSAPFRRPPRTPVLGPVPALGRAAPGWWAIPAAGSTSARRLPNSVRGKRAPARGALSAFAFHARHSAVTLVVAVAALLVKAGGYIRHVWTKLGPGIAALAPHIRARADLTLSGAQIAASRVNAAVQAIGATVLAIGRALAAIINRGVDAIGSVALDGGRAVATRWPSVAPYVRGTAHRAIVRSIDRLHPKLAPLAARASRSCRRAVGFARSTRVSLGAAANAAGSRYLFRALDAVLTAPVAQRGQGSVGRIFVPLRQAHFKRVQTVANVLESRWPQLALLIRKRLVREETLAFSAYRRPELIGFGAGSTVYRMPSSSTPAEDAVLKVLRRSLGRESDVVFAEARDAQESYRRLATLYDGADLVVPTHYLVLQSPLLGRPAAACLQPCLTGEMKDLFDYAEEELLDLLREHAALAKQFRLFVQRTVESLRTTHTCVDLLGHSNVLILPTAEGPRMRIIDFGVMQLDELLRQRPQVARELRRRISRLVRLDAELSLHVPPSGARTVPNRTRTKDSEHPGELTCPR